MRAVAVVEHEAIQIFPVPEALEEEELEGKQLTVGMVTMARQILAVPAVAQGERLILQRRAMVAPAARAS